MVNFLTVVSFMQVADYAVQTTFIKASVYDTNFFISFFVRSICVINVLRIENRSKSLESACFSFKIHILHWKWTICCLKEKYGGLHER